MSPLDAAPAAPASRGEAEALVPVLPAEGGSPDPVALATWHLALGASITVQVPNDLFALWLFPASGGSILLGPAALAEDRVEPPQPSPRLLQDELYRMEELLRRARYHSAIAVPVRSEGNGGGRDVGLMLLGSFAKAAFGPAQASALHRMARALVPAMTQLSDTLPGRGPDAPLTPQVTRETLPELLARAACDAVGGADLVRRASGILYALLPHDRAEILVPGSAGTFVALSGSAPRRRWATASSHASGTGGTGNGTANGHAGLVAKFGSAATLLLEEADASGSEPGWQVGSGNAMPARSVLGARLEVGGRLAGYLLLGSVARNLYRPADEDTLALAATVLAPRVALLRSPEAATAEASEAAADAAPLSRAVEVLARTAHLAQGLAQFAAELSKLAPHDGLSLRLCRGDNEVIALDPGAPHPLADLPPISVDESEGAAVLRGEREWELSSLPDAETLFVPLRVAGRTVGVLGVRGAGFGSPEGSAALVRQFADVLAPHLELLRRGGAGGAGGMTGAAALAVTRPLNAPE